MIDLILGTILALDIGNQDFNLKVLEEKTIISESRPTTETLNVPGKLTFTISSDFIDFGIIKPTSPVIRENILTASSSGTLGYSLVAFEDHPLRQSFSEASPLRPSTDAGQDIPDTTCDNGSCRENLASEWVNPLAYGFGLSLTPTTSGKYQQFASDQPLPEKKQIIVNGSPFGKQEVKVTYKVNVSKMQANGVYTNKITYILVSNF